MTPYQEESAEIILAYHKEKGNVSWDSLLYEGPKDLLANHTEKWPELKKIRNVLLEMGLIVMTNADTSNNRSLLTTKGQSFEGFAAAAVLKQKSDLTQRRKDWSERNWIGKGLILAALGAAVSTAIASFLRRTKTQQEIQSPQIQNSTKIPLRDSSTKIVP